jgi:hypothetical protein
MAILDHFKIEEIKSERDRALKELAVLKATLVEIGGIEYSQLKTLIEELRAKHATWIAAIPKVEAFYNEKKVEQEKQLGDLIVQVEMRKKEIIVMDDEILLQSFGVYTPKYKLKNTEAYSVRLDTIRAKQELMIKENKAAYGQQAIRMNNNIKEGEKMVNDYVKLILRSFNNECDTSISNVKFSNLESTEKKILKAFEILNKLGQRMSIIISQDYLNLKIQELYLCHEYAIKKQEEKEEQKRLKEQMREDAKVQREIDDLKNKIEKEERHFVKALNQVNERLSKAKTEIEVAMLKEEKASIEKNLVDVEKDKLDVFNREKNTRAGYVYIISNIGSFGENVYKIGVTRRFDPTERVDELGDASVPFDFDIHATIFSDDAPALEFALHKAFSHRRLNMINNRREFFSVTLDEIETVVKKNFKKPVEIVHLPDAPEYRQSLQMKELRVETVAV